MPARAGALGPAIAAVLVAAALLPAALLPSAVVGAAAAASTGRAGSTANAGSPSAATGSTPTGAGGACAGAGHAPTTPPAVVGGLALGWLPAGLGTATADRYAFDGVRVRACVWRSVTADGARVDLQVLVMRGRRLGDPAALRAWLLRYQQRHPVPHYLPVTVVGRSGWLAPDQVFWWLRPGEAASVQLDGRRWPTWALVRLVRASTVTGPAAVTVR